MVEKGSVGRPGRLTKVFGREDFEPRWNGSVRTVVEAGLVHGQDLTRLR